jgi:hypothetical protein
MGFLSSLLSMPRYEGGVVPRRSADISSMLPAVAQGKLHSMSGLLSTPTFLALPLPVGPPQRPQKLRKDRTAMFSEGAIH